MSIYPFRSLAIGVCSVSLRFLHLVRFVPNARFMFTFPILKQLVRL